jgi:hypothetical protein
MSEQFYAYKFTDASQSYWFSNVAHRLVLAGETYEPTSISHTPPTFSSDPSQARVQVRMRDDLAMAINYVSHPPPTTTELTIYEVLATTPSGNTLTVTEYADHWRGQIVRIAWRDSFRAVEMTCKTKQDIHFAREAMVESLNPLCRFHVGDGRCPVNIEDFKETAVVVDVGDDVSEPTVEVSGLSHIDTYYKAGMIRLADGDMRMVELAASGVLTLNRAFPSTSVQVGDSVEVFAGDDLTQETCTVVYGAQTDSGAAWGGWKLTPNRDYQKDGIR